MQTERPFTETPDLKCPHANKGYDPRYEAIYCKDCGHWLERRCNDSECEMCRGRPPIREQPR